MMSGRQIFQKLPSEVFYKKKILKNFPENSQENTCDSVFFLIKLPTWTLQLY